MSRASIPLPTVQQFREKLREFGVTAEPLPIVRPGYDLVPMMVLSRPGYQTILPWEDTRVLTAYVVRKHCRDLGIDPRVFGVEPDE